MASTEHEEKFHSYAVVVAFNSPVVYCCTRLEPKPLLFCLTAFISLSAMDPASDKQNENPTIFAPHVRRRTDNLDDLAEEPIDTEEVYEMIRHLNDPEHPLTLEQLNVTGIDGVYVDNVTNTGGQKMHCGQCCTSLSGAHGLYSRPVIRLSSRVLVYALISRAFLFISYAQWRFSSRPRSRTAPWPR